MQHWIWSAEPTLLNQSNLFLGVLGYRKRLSDQRDTEIFMIPLSEGSEVSQLALESRAAACWKHPELLKVSAARVWNPEDPTSFGDGTWPQPGCVYQVLMGTVLTAVASTCSASFPSTNTNICMFNVFLLSLIIFLKCVENWAEKKFITKIYRFTNLM